VAFLVTATRSTLATVCLRTQRTRTAVAVVVVAVLTPISKSVRRRTRSVPTIRATSHEWPAYIIIITPLLLLLPHPDQPDTWLDMTTDQRRFSG